MTDIQTILVEADEQTRVAMRTALRSQPGIEVASEATNGATGLVLLESIDVDVAVVNADLPDMDLDEFLQSMIDLQADSCVIPSKLLVLVNPGQEAGLRARLQPWSNQTPVAFSLKQDSIEAIAQTIRAIHTGQIHSEQPAEAAAEAAH